MGGQYLWSSSLPPAPQIHREIAVTPPHTLSRPGLIAAALRNAAAKAGSVNVSPTQVDPNSTGGDGEAYRGSGASRREAP